MPILRPFRGFPWWLPLLSAAAAAAITALIINSADPVWAADSRVWVPDERLPAQHVQAILDEPQTFEDAMELTLWEQNAADLAAATSVDIEGTLITLRVSTHNPALAEQMAASLAEIVVDKCYERNPGPAHPETLGVTWPGAQRVAPSPSGGAALAGLGGLLGGLALAAALGRTRTPPPPSTLALLARQGWRPLAVLAQTEQAEQTKQSAAGEPPPSALQLADALSAALKHGRTTAFAPLHEDADPALPALQAARALAGRGLNVLWFDARPARPALRVLPAARADQPTPVLPLDIEHAPLPRWLQGAPTPPWNARMRRVIAANSERFDAIVLVAAEPAPTALADHVVLAARDDFNLAGAQAGLTPPLPRSVPVLGLALTHAAERRAADFQSALDEVRENTD